MLTLLDSLNFAMDKILPMGVPSRDSRVLVDDARPFEVDRAQSDQNQIGLVPALARIGFAQTPSAGRFALPPSGPGTGEPARPLVELPTATGCATGKTARSRPVAPFRFLTFYGGAE